MQATRIPEVFNNASLVLISSLKQHAESRIKLDKQVLWNQVYSDEKKRALLSVSAALNRLSLTADSVSGTVAFSLSPEGGRFNKAALISLGRYQEALAQVEGCARQAKKAFDVADLEDLRQAQHQPTVELGELLDDVFRAYFFRITHLKYVFKHLLERKAFEPQSGNTPS